MSVGERVRTNVNTDPRIIPPMGLLYEGKVNE